MAGSHRRGNASVPWPTINRLAQYNLALAISISAMIRLSMSFSESQGDRPDSLTLLGFFAAMAVAIVFVYFLRKEVRQIRSRWQRVLAGILSFSIQLAVLEVLILLVAE